MCQKISHAMGERGSDMKMDNGICTHLSQLPCQVVKCAILFCEIEERDCLTINIDTHAQSEIDSFCRGESSSSVSIINKFNSYGVPVYSDDGTDNAKFIFFELASNEEMDTVIVSWIASCNKLWLNGKLIYAGENRIPTFMPFFVSLAKGDNLVVIELYQQTKIVEIDIWINALSHEKVISAESLLADNIVFMADQTFLACLVSMNENQGCYEYILTTNNQICFDMYQEIECIILKDFDAHIVHRDTLRLYERRKYNFSHIFLHPMDDAPFPLVMKHIYKTMNGVERCLETIIPFCDLRVSLSRILDEFYCLPSLSQYDCIEVRYEAERFNNLKTIRGQYNCIKEIKNIISLVEERVNFEHRLHKAGYQRRYFLSRLDSNVSAYGISLPKGYQKNKKYPLLIVLPSAQYSENASIVGHGLHEEAITVDIDLRGDTQGNYISIAFFEDAYKDILRSYCVDSNRIYLVGYCAGAITCSVLAQAFPHRFAGMLCIISRFNLDTVRNLSNMNVITVDTRYDPVYCDIKQSREHIVSTMPRFLSIETDSITIPVMYGLQYKRYFLDLLLSCKREEYPNEIHYRTKSNQFRTAYWVELDSISQSGEMATICVIASCDRINITTENVSGITIKIPPYLNREMFVIDINETLFKYERFYNDSIHYTLDGVPIPTEKAHPSEPLKGCGIVSCYLGKLRIYVPQQAEEVLQSLAQLFSTPSSMVNDGQQFVKYDICPIPVHLEDIHDENIIVIDLNTDEANMHYWRDKCRIKMTSEDISYMDFNYKGTYCIMQVFPHPHREGRVVLHINSNDSQLFAKCLFTRKIYIPTILQNNHPYLDNVALLYLGRKYYQVREWGLPIVELSFC